jgi:GTPase SAR1 family protein
MKIEEEENTVLQVKAFDNQLKASSGIHPDLLQPPFTLLLVAPKGSGKSTAILRLIYGNKRAKGKKTKDAHHRMYRGFFDKVYVFSPTWQLDAKCDRCGIPDDQIFDDQSLYEETIAVIIAGQQADIEADGKEDAPSLLLIFSDLAGTKLFSSKKGIMNKLAFNHRHYNISLIIDTQSLRQINTAFRENLSGIMLFSGISNRKEITKLTDEYLGKYTEKQALEILDYVFDDSAFNFLYINFQQRGALFRNFNRITITEA